ncbi:hypothetical protein [Mesorhizobium sp. M2A.F.Ca.ET.029.05.1.1]|uniref:hypothetical protein n=1 Tax=Mesorhizobium sp. M2A.F.Ca.ET.029.05.1.1 TaxID=2496658 RepID=UPI001AECA3BF|nr:hypothetical protein [Mesorhizobium sp. M2A.F.Ca.ET.029.05.1.1]
MQIAASRKNGRPRGYIDEYRPQAKTLALLNQVYIVLDEYREHWPLTIRQVFYRLVGRFDYPKDEAAYERLCTHMSNARRARRISFDSIRDDGVITLSMNHFDDVEHFRRHVRGLSENYRKNLMASQPRHIEVWCEAAGMIHQLADVAHDYSIRVYSSSGFDSTTAKKDIADHICTIGKPAVILHLGDYDPSGESVFEAMAEDVKAFVEADRPWATVDVEFRRTTLTADQVERYRLPTSPAKSTDSRTKRWGDRGTCQLEALAPDEIADILRAAIDDVIAPFTMEFDRSAEEAERQELTRLLTFTASRENDGGRQ